MTNTTYSIDATFGAGYDVTYTYSFREGQFVDASRSDGEGLYTVDADEALRVFKSQPEGNNANSYSLIKDEYNEENGDTLSTVLATEKSMAFYA